jgi:hypothetical protein
MPRLRIHDRTVDTGGMLMTLPMEGVGAGLSAVASQAPGLCGMLIWGLIILIAVWAVMNAWKKRGR